MESKQETLFIAQEDIDALKYSPADTFVVTCCKQNSRAADNQMLKILEAASGRTVVSFAWHKSAKEGIKTVKWSDDESICM